MNVEAGGVEKTHCLQQEAFRTLHSYLMASCQDTVSIINMEGGRLLSWPWLKSDSCDTVSFGGEDCSDVSSRFSQGYEPVISDIGKYFFCANLGTRDYAVASRNTYWAFVMPN
jgi:hypothetical protein